MHICKISTLTTRTQTRRRTKREIMADDDVERSLSCCQRWAAEWKCPWFGLEEPHDPTKTINIVSTFRPSSMVVAVIKVLLWAFGIGCLVELLVSIDSPKVFWLAYLSYWSFLVAILYLTLSCLWIVLIPRPDSLLLKVTWVMYSLAASAQILVTLLFWALDYDPDNEVRFGTVTAHGLIMLVVFVDGAVINRVPVRAKHFLVFSIYEDLFVLWSILHAVSGIGNPYLDDETDDDALYGVLNWNKNVFLASILSIVVVVVVSPILFLIVWSISAYGAGKCCRFDGSRRRYLPVITSPRDDVEQPADT